jgi:hypothetical protein
MDYSFFNGKQLTPQQFYTTLRGVHKILKSANPQNKVVLGALNRVRSSFLDTLCKYDAQEYFDVMSFTSYGDAESITGQANGLKRTMRKYGFEKPVWMTSVYYGSMPVENTSDGFWMDVVPAALSRLGLSLKKTEVAVVTGLRKGVPALNDYQIDRYLERRFKMVHRISNTEIDSLDPQVVPVLIPGKNVPSSDVAAYMAKGGTVILEEPLWPAFTHIGVLNGLSEKASTYGAPAVPERARPARGFSFTLVVCSAIIARVSPKDCCTPFSSSVMKEPDILHRPSDSPSTQCRRRSMVAFMHMGAAASMPSMFA